MRPRSCILRAIVFKIGVFAILFLTIGIGPSFAQETATLRGFVTGHDDGQPLIGVNVVLSGPSEEFYGSATDGDGFYVIPQVPLGTFDVTATFIGYDTIEEQIELAAAGFLRRDFSMQPSETALDEVVVEGQRTAGAAAIRAGLQEIKPIDIERIPVPGVSADLAGYLTALPGVVSSGDRGGQLFIRGGTPTQNAVLVDGMLLYQPFHILGFYSAFPSELVQQADVFAGGFGARYGGRISSVIDISTRTGNKRRYTGGLSVSPFLAEGHFEGPIIPGRMSFLTSVRESLVERAATDLVDRPLPYTFGDQFGKLHWTLSNSVQASVSAIRTHDRGFIVSPEELDPGDVGRAGEVSWRNEAYGVRWLVLPATLPILAEVLLSTTLLENDFGPRAAPDRASSIRRSGATTNATYYAKDVDVKFGLGVYALEIDNQLGGQFQDVEDSKEFVSEAAAYVEAEIKSFPRLALTAGARVQSFPSVGSTSVEPRVKIVWTWGIHEISGALGRYSQQIVGLNDRRDAGNVFTAWTVSPSGTEAPVADHALLGYHISATRLLDFSAEAFYKRLSNLAIAEWTAFPRFTTNLQPADGSAKGFEVRAEFDSRLLYTYVTYGYNKVTYDAGQPSLSVWYGSPSLEFSPPHDRRHQLNALARLTFLGFDLSVLWQYGSGLPYSQSVGFAKFVLLDDTFEYVDVRHEGGQERVVYGEPYAARLPAYHRLDVSLERQFQLAPRVAATIQAGLINSYDRLNLFYLDLFTLRRVDQLPLFPSMGFKLDFE